MEQAFGTFGKDESGAVTVDWVVLIPIAYSSDNSAQGISDYITGIDVGYDNNN